MSLFGKRLKKKLPPTEETIDIEKALAEIGARQKVLEALTLEIIKDLTPKKRESLLARLNERVVELATLPPPGYVSSHKQTHFQRELHTVVRVLVERSTSWPI